MRPGGSPAGTARGPQGDHGAAEAKAGRGRGARKVAEQGEDYARLDASQAAAKLRELEQKMYQHARDLEFEDAAQVRDQIRRLKEATLGGAAAAR